MKKKIKVLLTPGGGPGILTQIESLRCSRKYDFTIILGDSNPASGNLFLDDVDMKFKIPLCSHPDYVNLMVSLIKQQRIDYWYSGLDEELPVIAANRTVFERAGCRFLLPRFQPLKMALNKGKTFDLLKSRIRMPKTIFLDKNSDAGSIWDQLQGSVLLKVLNSRGGRHIYIPESRQENRFFFEKLYKLMDTELKFIAQELIQGDEYNVSMLHDFNSESIYAVSRRKFETRAVKSTTTAAVIERREDVIEQALEVVKKMELWPGFNNVECIVSNKDDRPYFIEINGGRTAAQDMNIVGSGIPIMDLMLELINGEDIPSIEHPPDGLAILKIKKDVLVNIHDIENVPGIII